MDTFLPSAEGITILGKPLPSLTKRELSATVVFLLSEMEEKQRVLNEIHIVQQPGRYSRSN